MKYKIVAISTPQPTKYISEWENGMISNFPERVEFFRNTELQSVTREKETTYLARITVIEEMMRTTSTTNIMKLINDPAFLIRNLPKQKFSNGYFLENHMAQFELVCLVINLKACWDQLSSNQINQLIDFLKNKTMVALNSDADCFGVSLKYTVDGLVKFQPQLLPRLSKVIAIRDELINKRNGKL